MKNVVSRSAQETAALGRSFGSGLKPGEIVALLGDLGSGKTQFVKGICSGIGVNGSVTSPTFTLINEYPAPFGIVAHIDLYRIGSNQELRDLDLESYFRDTCICLIEWAERARAILPSQCRRVTLAHGEAENQRVVTVDDGVESFP